jgi:phosphohistidine swiveling domain-containing protein
VLCQGGYGRVAALRADLAAQLVSGDGKLAEAAVANDLWALAHGSLTEAAFLARHGFHGPDEGELASPSWREDPAPVRATAQAWAGADDERSPIAAAARRTGDRRRAERDLLEAMPRGKRPTARALVAATRRLVVQREIGKASFLRHLDVARYAARALGPDAVWCTLAELRTARPSATVLDERRSRRAALAALDLPLSWSGDPQPLVAPAVLSGHAVRGLGVSPGVVEGRARVVTDPALLTEPLEPDEILVARTTDPSWVTVFLTAGALVIDVGGALSHGAIIARELGIPCVIGTGDGTRQIPDGARVKVDGTTGTVEVANC